MPTLKSEHDMVVRGLLAVSQEMPPEVKAEYVAFAADLTRVFVAHPEVAPNEVLNYLDKEGRERASSALMMCGCMLYGMLV